MDLDRVMSMLELKINIILPQLLCFVVRNGEFQRFGEFWVDCYYSSYKGDKGGKLIFNRSSAKPIFAQKLESPDFQIEQQIN